MQRIGARYVTGCIASFLAVACSLTDLSGFSGGSITNLDAGFVPDSVNPNANDAARISDGDGTSDAGFDATEDGTGTIDAGGPCEHRTIQSTPFQIPGAAFSLSRSDGTVVWETPERALAKDNASAEAAASYLPKKSEFLAVSKFAFGLPSDVRISGVEIEIFRFVGNLTGGPIYDNAIALTLNGDVGTIVQRKSDAWLPQSGATAVAYGGPTETFGVSLKDPATGKWLTGSDINENQFLLGAAISVEVNPIVPQTQTAKVDAIRMKVHYCQVGAAIDQ